MSRRKILFLNSRSELGGADFCLLEVVRYLDKNRFEPLVGLPGPGPLVNDLVEAGAEVLYLDLRPLEKPERLLDVFWFLIGFLPSTLRLVRILRQRKVDLVYTNSSAIQIGALAARICRIPNIWHVREIWTKPRWLIRGLNLYIYRMANHIIAISQSVSDHNFGSQRLEKVTILHDGIDLTVYGHSRDKALLESFGIDANKLILGMVTRLVPRKGAHLLVEAAGKLMRQGHDFYVLIVGDVPRSMYDNYKRDLLRRVDELDLSSRVFFTGWQPNVSSFLHQMDVLVLPSVIPEPFGRVILEAWAASVPVVAAAHGGPVEIIRPGQNGVLFQPNNATDLARQIAYLLDHEEKRRTMGLVGQQDVQLKFDIGQSVSQIQSICERLLRPEG